MKRSFLCWNPVRQSAYSPSPSCPIISVTESPSTLLSRYTFPALASLLFLQQIGDPLTSGCLYLLFPLSGPLFFLYLAYSRTVFRSGLQYYILCEDFPSCFLWNCSSQTVYFLLSFPTLLFSRYLSSSHTSYISHFHFVFCLLQLECKVCFHVTVFPVPEWCWHRVSTWCTYLWRK